MSSLDLLIWLEQCRTPLLDAVMTGLSALGSEEAYLAILTIVYLCVSHRAGFRLMVVFLASGFSNAQAKHLFGTIRPYLLYPEQLDALYETSGGGLALPSGHAQNAAAVWGLAAVWQRRWLARAGLLVLIFSIGVSRVYCHLHWPADVLAGWAIGAAIVGLYLYVAHAWERSGRRLAVGNSLLLVIGISGLMLVTGWELPTCVKAAGGMLGAGIGFTLLVARGGYKADAPPATQIAKVLISVPALLGARALGSIVFGGSQVGRFATYTLVALTCTYLLPMLFVGFYHWRRRARRAMEMLEDPGSGGRGGD